ncbi:mandelate racemase [Ramlibacter sp. USB13]|uniref:Mandelate racemase n=1 Tax=Ramlibacter cellulosilyticus TaxID=2764187 RepID=A0A923SFL2_9BURK|nr:enolase C-terminal domain-like protein [Ramlibacter cellulosilyticus]MBC5784062.1 mandelate racemase [Ramlibacter cellulosilyticus]
MLRDSAAPVEDVQAWSWRIPTDAPESDGTFAWNATTLVLAQVRAGGREGIGYSYGPAAGAALVRESLAQVLHQQDALDTMALFVRMRQAARNLGRQGVAALAISAVDAALWDLKGKLLGQPVVHLLGGAARRAVAVYGSGGFTSYDRAQLQEQLAGWASQGMRFVKMKVGREPAQDPQRVAWAREAVGPDTQIFVDANGACTRSEALALAQRFAECDVRWFEEPVSSDDVPGLCLLRHRAPARMEIAAGEYGFDLLHFRSLLEGGAVDVLQADATRCGGLTGFMAAAALCQAHGVPLSSHCAPALHVAACCCAATAVHMEWFHDHARIERMLFDGAPQPVQGLVEADRSRPGLGLAFRWADAKEYAS